MEDAATEDEPKTRQSYQFVFERNQACADSDTSCENLALGPVTIIAKNSAPSVVEDSFDGNPRDGLLDVAQARDAWAANTIPAAEETVVNRFLQQVRNRAEVNGGSIDLAALVLTGRVGNNAANGFATFSNQRLLISPCFPVVKADSYNLEIYGNVVGFPRLFKVTQSGGSQITSAQFVDTDGEFVDTTGPFAVSLVEANGASTNEAITTPTGTIGVNNIGTAKAEKCTAFSYFE